MATYKWSVKPANLISGTTLIKETDNKIQANLDDIADFINGEGEYLGQGLTFDMLDKNSSQTVLGIKTFTNGIVSNVIGNVDGNVNGNVTGSLIGNSSSATKLQTARNIALSGDVTGTISFDGTSDVSIVSTILDDSHNHIISNIDNLQEELNLKATFASPTFTGVPKAPTAIVSTDNEQIATTAFVRDIIPSGIITMWSGSIATIPAGWALCNGQNGTPNLIDRFVIMAGSTYNVGSIGGSKDAIVVSHTHTQAAHNHTATTDSSGAHTHSLVGTRSDGYTYYGATKFYTTSSSGPISSTDALKDTGVLSSGAHTHSLTTTTVTPAINSTGSDGTNANLPPYYALAYIMKL